MNRVVAGRYRLLAPLGAGAMGTVWRAFDQVLDTEAALKEIEFAGGVPDGERADRVERALREARHAAKLRGHPHVVTILDVVQQDGLPWIVMELVPSRSLFQVVREDGPLPPDEVARVGAALLDALIAAADFGIMHRDVKPSNVLIGTEGRVVLTDFGIATGDGDPTLTVTGVLGTPLYMAPERLNNAPATLEADLFSLGGTLYFAVEGHAPFERDSFGAMLAAIVLQPPTPPHRAGPITDVLLGLLEKDPAVRMRPAQAQRMLTAVARRPATPPPGEWSGAPGSTIPGMAASPDDPTELSQPLDPAPLLDEAARLGSATRLAPTARLDPAAGLTGVARPAPPAELTAVEQDGAIALRWAPSPSPGVVYRVSRMVADATAPGGWRARSLGTTSVTELFDAGIPKGVPVWHQVAAVYRSGPRGGGAPAGEAPGMSRPVSTPARTILPVIAALRADLSGDSVLLSWRPTPGHDEVVIERTFHASSSVQGAMRRFRAARGQFVDGDVQPGATYQYRVWVASEDRAEAAEPTQSAEVTVTAIPRPRAVLDLESRKTLGGVVLGWRTVPGATVRIYATPAGTVPGLAGTGPFGPAGHEVTTGSLEGRARLVGESRRGRLVDQEGGAVVYTPVSVAGDRAVIGTAVHQT